MDNRFKFLLLSFFLLSSLLRAEEIYIAVIGGTSFGAPLRFGEGLAEREREFQVETPAGLSPTIYQMRYKGVPFYYIPMYGNLDLDRSEAEYLGLIRSFAAFHELGVTHLLGGASSGGVKAEYENGDIFILTDFMEWESLRPSNILRYTGISRPGFFPNFEVPFSPSLNALLIDEAKKRIDDYPGKLYESAFFGQHSPGRFESPGEVRAMALHGVDLTSMYQASCAIYARQLGIRYASISSVANPAVGVRPFTFGEMQQAVQMIASFAVPVVLEVIARIPAEAMEPEPSSTGDPYTGAYTDPNAKTN